MYLSLKPRVDGDFSVRDQLQDQQEHYDQHHDEQHHGQHQQEYVENRYEITGKYSLLFRSM